MSGEFRSQPWNFPTSPPIANKRSSSLFEPFLFVLFFEAVPSFYRRKEKGEISHARQDLETMPFFKSGGREKVFQCSPPFWGRDRWTTSPCLPAKYADSAAPRKSLSRKFSAAFRTRGVWVDKDCPNISCHNSRIFIFDSFKNID